ncbi:MAG TPA: hypothetical protein VNK48_14560 [Xanthobacteraceae bacterium]|nr:hypothetical protein [Xanthobacteraceae bacterium]
MTVVDFDLARIEREQDNKKVGVADLLRYALANIDKGEHKDAKRAILCIIEEHEDGRVTLDGYRCGLSRLEEVGYLEAYQAQRLRAWWADA